MKIIPNEDDLLVMLETELRYDNLYNLIIEREQLKKELFHPGFISTLEKDIHRWYSVAEAGRVIGGDKPIPPSSITYYIDNLREYIIPEDAPSNKYIRLNYLSLIKIKMVFLLKDEFRLNGLRAEVGLAGIPKNITNSNESVNEEIIELKEKLEKFETMNQMLWGLLVEKGEDGKPRLKKQLKSLMESERLLIEEQSSFNEKLREQNEIIDSLKLENQSLIERIEKAEQQSSGIDKKLEEKDIENVKLLERMERAEVQSTEIVKKLEEKDKEREKILESEKKINTLAETIRARQQAEEEWEKLSIFKKMKGNRSDFVTRRINEILNK